MSLTPPLIEVHNLRFSYGSNVVLDNVSFTIEQGDYVGVIGPNGGGKTTLLKILIGLLPSQAGTVRIMGTPIEAFKQKYQIGYVPQRVAQENASFPATVYEVVESGCIPKKKLFEGVNAQDRESIERALEIAKIVDLKDRLMSDLSGGQRQRVYVARALVSQPKMLILDEPFVGIDITTQKDFYAFLKELNEQQQLTILFVSHDIDIIAEEVRSVLCLNKGLLCFGNPSLLHEPNMMENLYGKRVTHIHHHAH